MSSLWIWPGGIGACLHRMHVRSIRISPVPVLCSKHPSTLPSFISTTRTLTPVFPLQRRLRLTSTRCSSDKEISSLPKERCPSRGLLGATAGRFEDYYGLLKLRELALQLLTLAHGQRVLGKPPSQVALAGPFEHPRHESIRNPVDEDPVDLLRDAVEHAPAHDVAVGVDGHLAERRV